jgi:hypothetical protein
MEQERPRANCTARALDDLEALASRLFSWTSLSFVLFRSSVGGTHRHTRIVAALRCWITPREPAGRAFHTSVEPKDVSSKVGSEVVVEVLLVLLRYVDLTGWRVGPTLGVWTLERWTQRGGG